MTKEYIGSIGTEHECMKFTLSTGKEIILSGQEQEELLGVYDGATYQQLHNQVEVLKTRLDKYKEAIDLYKQFSSTINNLR